MGISPKRDLYNVFTAAPSEAPPHQQVMKQQNVEDRQAHKGGKPKPHYNVDETDAKRCQLHSVSSAVSPEKPTKTPQVQGWFRQQVDT